MNLAPSEDQAMIAETFARFLYEHSNMARVRKSLPSGFDPSLWRGLGELGAFDIRVPESAGGLGLGLFDAALLMERAGRTLVSGPLAEVLVAARLLAVFRSEATAGLRAAVASGDALVTIALHNVARRPTQLIAGGAVAQAVIARDANTIVLVEPTAQERRQLNNLASTPVAEVRLDRDDRKILAQGEKATAAFLSAVEEWKLLTAAALAGISAESIRLAAAYAAERKAFGQFIGSYQGISHPLADLIVDADAGKLAVWNAIRRIADNAPDAGAQISLALWWNARTASLAVAQSLHTFGGYGLTTEYDIHLYNLRAKALPLMLGDPEHLLAEAGRRLYAGEIAPLPQAGVVAIDFDLGEEARAFAAEVDAFFNKTLTPELRAKAHFSFDGHDAGVHKKLAEAELLFPAWPREYGGRAAGPYMMAAAAAVWEKHGWSLHAAGTTNMIGFIMQRFGSDELKREALSRVVAGEVICSLGFSEPGSGSDVFAAVTRATPEGNGWRIDGSKMFTSGANIAAYVLLLARTDFNVPKHKGLTMFIVPLDAEGVEIQPVYTFQDERTNITFYNGVYIPDSYRLGDVGGGLKVMAASLEMEHGGGGFIHVQVALLEAAETFCRETVRDGRPMIEYPEVATRLARVKAHTTLSTLIGARTLWTAAERRPGPGFGPAAKLFSSEKFRIDSSDLLDLTAPESLLERDGPAAFINQCYRHSQGTTIYGGTSEIHRSLIAERQLGLPRTRT